MMANHMSSWKGSGMSEPMEHDAVLGKKLHDGWMQRQPTASAPIVGIPFPVRARAHGPQLVADAVGAWALERMGARLLLVPLWPLPTHQQVYQSLWPLLQSMDGLLLPAGVAEPGEASPRDTPMSATGTEGWLSALAQLATSLGMPLLAIADGAHRWNTALGGSSRQMVSDALGNSRPDTWTRASLQVYASSMLASLLASGVPTDEHEGEPPPWELAGLPMYQVERLAPGLRACAHAEDGLIVAFERVDGAFGLGMSGRLEWELEQPASRAIFAAFLLACCAFDAQRSRQSFWEHARESICTTLMQRVVQGQPLIRGVQASAPLSPQSIGLTTLDRQALHEAAGQQRMRHRSALPSKEERNRMRRQRWNQRE